MAGLSLLLAIDDSEAALHACRLVAAYAGDRAALRITLLNVQRPLLQVSLEPGVSRATLEAALLEEGRQQLEPARSLLVAAGCSPVSVVRVGPPAETLLDAVREHRSDVLVMGGGRQGVLKGYALGSVALRVAPGAACPVVLVQAGNTLPVNAGVSLRVMAPVDGSPEATAAVRRLAACAGFLGQLHVDLVHFRPGLTLAAAMMPPHDDVLRQWSGSESEAALAEPERILAEAGIAHASHRETGVADTGIAAFAQSSGAELIVMGTRGTGAMHHLLLGSAALRTAHLSGVPVALLR